MPLVEFYSAKIVKKSLPKSRTTTCSSTKILPNFHSSFTVFRKVIKKVCCKGFSLGLFYSCSQKGLFYRNAYEQTTNQLRTNYEQNP